MDWINKAFVAMKTKGKFLLGKAGPWSVVNLEDSVCE